MKISDEELAQLDSLYFERNADGREIYWGFLVENLRKIRRSIEAGEVVTVSDGSEISTVLDFHVWAYARFKLLEEGVDSWIGDDES